MALKGMVLSAQQMLPPEGKGILVGVRPNVIYEDGKPKCEDGIKVTVAVFPDMEKIVVKLPGVEAPVEQEKLTQANLAGQFLLVSFVGFSATIYHNYKTNEMGTACTAKAMKLEPFNKEKGGAG